MILSPRRLIEKYRVASEDIRQIDPEKIAFADVIGIFVRGAPYISPLFGHLIAYLAIAIFHLVWEATAGAIILTLIYNNVILDAPVAPIAAVILFLDFAQYVDVEALTADQRFGLVPAVVMLAVVSGSLGAVIDNANKVYRVWIMQEINQNLRLHLMSQLGLLSLKFHSQSKAGDAIYRLFQDSAMVTQIIQALVIDPILIIARFLFGLGVVFLFNPILALVVLLTWFPMLWLAKVVSPKLRTGFQLARFRNAALTSNIQETIEGIRTIKVNGLEDEHQRKFEAHSVDAFHAAHDARVRLLLFSFYAFMCAASPLAFIELSAALYAYEGVQTFAFEFLLAFGFAVWNLGSQDAFRIRARESVNGVQNLLILWGRAQDMAMGLNRVYQILDLTPEIRDVPDAMPVKDSSIQVEFKDLDFAYQTMPIFERLSFTAEAGQITALMGPTGTGKSTLMMLLLRMYEYQGGEILLNGTPIRQFQFEGVRNQITLATQENILFSMSVRDNIRYARPAATDEEVEHAAKVACADEFISALPEGYDTHLGEKSTKLSTGQRQRLVIARALCKDAPILILDEPTASLDARTEHQILQNIREWAEGRTVFLITHRLSTIRQAHRIAFMKDRQVVEFGSHEDLLEIPSGEYKAFVDAELSTAEQQVA